jgi:hypothetical protein
VRSVFIENLHFIKKFVKEDPESDLTLRGKKLLLGDNFILQKTNYGILTLELRRGEADGGKKGIEGVFGFAKGKIERLDIS